MSSEPFQVANKDMKAFIRSLIRSQSIVVTRATAAAAAYEHKGFRVDTKYVDKRSKLNQFVCLHRHGSLRVDGSLES